MDVRDKVLEIREGRNFAELQEFFRKNPHKVKELVQLVVDQVHYPIEEYGSWILVHLCKSQKEQIIPFYNIVVDTIFESKNQSVIRNLINVVHHLDITDYRESEFIDLLIGFIQDSNHKVAVHVYSIYVLAQFSIKYPELKSEIKEVIELNLEGKSPAFRVAKRNFSEITKNI